MSFTAGFYTFSISLSHVDKSLYVPLRFKTLRHPEETLSQLYGRVIALAHAYEIDMSFTQGIYEPKDPSFWKRDAISNVLTWGQVGVPDRKKVERALKEFPNANFKIYLLSGAEVAEFANHLKGSRTNWIRPIEFFLIRKKFLSRIKEPDGFRSTWEMTIADNKIYLVADGLEYRSTVDHIDMWDEFQKITSQ